MVLKERLAACSAKKESIVPLQQLYSVSLLLAYGLVYWMEKYTYII